MKKLIIILLASNLSLAVVVYFLVQHRRSQSQQQMLLSKKPEGGLFQLGKGKNQIDLHQHKDKLILLYFGYTYCPDICPTTLSTFGRALKQLTADELAKILPIFITIDPERDTGEKMDRYTKFFHNSILGVVDTPAHVKKIADLYGVEYKKFFPKKGDPYYTVDHSTQSFLVSGKTGKILKIIPHGIHPDQLKQELQSQLQNFP